jgi:UDP-N-acetylglucosamine/UDP-N-acetylgalactosamine diphosphorylase
MSADLKSLQQKLAQIGQDHVLRFADQLDESGRAKLASQLAALELPRIAELAEQYVRNKPELKLPTKLEPVQVYPRQATEKLRKLYDDARAKGEQMLRAGQIAAFLVAGGQGTRLGYDGPKGEYPVTPIKNKPLFEVFAEQLLNQKQTYGKSVPWYIMTSDVNDAPTRAFFKKHTNFGYPADDVVFFQQGMMPAFATDGKMLLGAKDSLALSPDGHGGSLRALQRSGALADMRRRGVEHLSYFQVDNPMVYCIDPLFLGLHALTASEMSSKTVGKAGPLEKVGNFVIGDGVMQVIEYSDLPESIAQQTNPDGSLRFNSGSIAIHALSVAFIERLNAGGDLKLPWHRAEKKVPYVDETGRTIKPDKINAVKLEQFVFDAIPLAKNAMVYATDRSEEFSPVKNAEGVDSPATCRRDQIRRSARWLRFAGVEIPEQNGEPAATLEISPLHANSPEQLRQRAPKISVKPGAKTYFGKDGIEHG